MSEPVASVATRPLVGGRATGDPEQSLRRGELASTLAVSGRSAGTAHVPSREPSPVRSFRASALVVAAELHAGVRDNPPYGWSVLPLGQRVAPGGTPGADGGG